MADNTHRSPRVSLPGAAVEHVAAAAAKSVAGGALSLACADQTDATKGRGSLRCCTRAVSKMPLRRSLSPMRIRNLPLPAAPPPQPGTPRGGGCRGSLTIPRQCAPFSSNAPLSPVRQSESTSTDGNPWAQASLVRSSKINSNRAQKSSKSRGRA
ncbi:hypothetical protein NDU88_007542 [Pleurodeles waltl]|uniref:Uncharacterized protein n=1 Tax=Pleurodeles waltl TaxID=8319 RepID=A0AAV7N2H4_PLEWA|nr:hypothetical protein NDU88_007542 [Pleurodeles waltl]